jgi:Family of unknown function (DUF5946)
MPDPLTEREAYHELCGYTLTHAGREFIHQYVVDAWAAQHATPDGKPIAITFALAGLYLHLEKKRTGREAQLAHMQMAKKKRTWPTFVLPAHRGDVTAIDVLRAPEGPERHEAIDRWCASVWAAYAPANRRTIVDLLAEYGL